MFFADPAKSFANLRTGLKPRGRLVFACWREPKQNPWLILPLREAAKHAPPLPETNPETDTIQHGNIRGRRYYH